MAVKSLLSEFTCSGEKPGSCRPAAAAYESASPLGSLHDCVMVWRLDCMLNEVVDRPNERIDLIGRGRVGGSADRWANGVEAGSGPGSGLGGRFGR